MTTLDDVIIHIIFDAVLDNKCVKACNMTVRYLSLLTSNVLTNERLVHHFDITSKIFNSQVNIGKNSPISESESVHF